MSRQWKPGNIALVEAGCSANRQIAVRSGSKRNPGWSYLTQQGMSRWTADTTETVIPIRRLVVLDLPDGARAGWPVLINALRVAREKTGYDMIFDGLIEQIQAQTEADKPEEPTGLGAVVVDTQGRRWVRAFRRYGTGWSSSDEEFGHADWADVDVVRVLSEGVTS